MDSSTNNDTNASSKKVFRQPLNYENGIILPKIREISLWRDIDLKAFESGVQTLVLLLPKELREPVLDHINNVTVKEDLTDQGKQEFDQILIYILELMEQHGIMFPRSTFDIGHD